jgi:hypothetical protein
MAAKQNAAGGRGRERKELSAIHDPLTHLTPALSPHRAERECENQNQSQPAQRTFSAPGRNSVDTANGV